MKHHQLVKNIIKQHLPKEVNEAELSSLFCALNNCFFQADEDRKELEQSIQFTSAELTARNKALEQQLNELKHTQKALKDSHS